MWFTFYIHKFHIQICSHQQPVATSTRQFSPRNFLNHRLVITCSVDVDDLFLLLLFKAPAPRLPCAQRGGAVSGAGPVRPAFLKIVFVSGRVYGGDAEVGHGGGEVEVGADPEAAGVGVEDVEVVARETRLYHHGFLQAVDKQFRSV